MFLSVGFAFLFITKMSANCFVGIPSITLAAFMTASIPGVHDSHSTNGGPPSITVARLKETVIVAQPMTDRL